MKTTPIGNRRQFLLGAGAASVATVATVVTTMTPVAKAPANAPAKAGSGRGYQLTEHVRNYYRTTAV